MTVKKLKNITLSNAIQYKFQKSTLLMSQSFIYLEGGEDNDFSWEHSYTREKYRNFETSL